MKNLFFVFIIILLTCSVSASDYFCLKKLSDKQSIPSSINSIGNNLICLGGKCTCHIRGGYCLVCTNSSGWYALFNKCTSNICSIDPNENMSLSMNIKTPEIDFSNRKLSLIINTTKLAKIDFINNGISKNLCMHCSYFNKIIFLNEGKNNIKIVSKIGDEEKSETFNFFIDTKKPRIEKVSPKQNSYNLGNFSVSYNENNLKNIILYYGDSKTLKSYVFKNCKNGRSTCSQKIDLSEFSVGKITFWFSITDISNNNINSSKSSFYYDSKKPVIESFNYIKNSRTSILNLKVDEDNFKKALYCVNNHCSTFCNSLHYGSCTRRFNSLLGNVEIRVYDLAGNFEKKNILVK